MRSSFLRDPAGPNRQQHSRAKVSAGQLVLFELLDVALLAVLAIFICRTVSAADDGPPQYEGRTAAQWIETLRSSADARQRAKAAEVLGFMSREGRVTYGGFSDVPIDSPEPPKLSEDALRPIVGALSAGLRDPEAAVRASSAIALSWIGPRAKAAVGPLVRALDEDRNAEVHTSVLTALGRMGSEAREAIPRLEALLKFSGSTKVAEALRLIGAPPETIVPALIAQLPSDHQAAMALGQLGDPAVPALLVALKHSNRLMRKNAAYTIANMAGWEKLTKNREAVAQALVELTRDDDKDVVWNATQAIGSVHAAPERCVPVLTALLEHSDPNVAGQAAEALGQFGADAKAAVPSLVRSLGRKDGSYQAEYAIRQIGLDRPAAEALRQLKLQDLGSWLLVPLTAYPEAAADFLRLNPQAVDVPLRDREALVRLMRGSEPALQPVRELLYQSEELPLAIVADLGDRRFLPLLERRLLAASAHEKSKLEACRRACGVAADRVVTIAAGRPGDFQPKSAWPGTDPSRLSPTARGHGDGFTEVIVTGQIVCTDGKPPAAVNFFRTNDAMLLGQRIREEEPLRFDPQTGRFVFITHVFAAYSSGKDQPQPGPYQTGSSRIQIESAGCRPLLVQFYDEMPDVRITLSASIP